MPRSARHHTYDYVLGLLLRAGVTFAEADRIARDVSLPELARAA
jgi:hypothetical protein